MAAKLCFDTKCGEIVVQEANLRDNLRFFFEWILFGGKLMFSGKESSESLKKVRPKKNCKQLHPIAKVIV